jgi:hypothetical protein
LAVAKNHDLNFEVLPPWILGASKLHHFCVYRFDLVLDLDHERTDSLLRLVVPAVATP